MSQMQSPGAAYRQPAPPPPLPQDRGPDRGMGWVKLILALVVLGVGGYLFYDNLDRAANRGGAWRWGERNAREDRSTGILLGVILGFGLWMLVNGAIQLTGRAPRWFVGMAVMALTIVGLTFGYGKAAHAARVKSEQESWDRLQASKKEYNDYNNYIEYLPIPPRKGVYVAAAQQRLKEEMAMTGDKAAGRVERLRSMVYDFDRQMKERGEPELKDSIGQAREALAATYAKAREDLDERLEKIPGRREFPEDQKMRDAFGAVLDRVARQETNLVYLAFTSESKVPSSVPAPPGVKDMVQPGDAFGADRYRSREGVFRTALEGSLRDAFKDPLIRIAPLEGDRNGKVVFQVHSVTQQLPGSTFELTRNQQPAGTLFGIEVLWEFTIFDADGKQLVKHVTRSRPAESFKFRFRRDDPTSAAYGYMMDSTYYNFCREVTGRLGLIPPPVKEDFSMR